MSYTVKFDSQPSRKRGNGWCVKYADGRTAMEFGATPVARQAAERWAARLNDGC